MKKLLVLGILIALCMVVGPVLAASISTDQAEYYPGDTVVIHGSGFTSDSIVHVTVTWPEPISTMYDVVPPSQANSAGEFSAEYTLYSSIEGIYTVVATDSTGLSAQTTFSDPAPIEVVTTTILNAITNPLIAGQTNVPYSGKVTGVLQSNGNPKSIPDGMDVHFQWGTDGINFPNSFTTQTSGGTGSFSGTFTAPSPAGTYYFRAQFPGAGNLGGYKYDNSVSTVQTITVNLPVAAPEFPSMALPAAFIVGLLGVVLFIKRNKENE
jgi:hypothetical protein